MWVLPTYADTDATKDYLFGNVLGKGSFGTTYAAKDRKTQAPAAIKVRAPSAPPPRAWVSCFWGLGFRVERRGL